MIDGDILTDKSKEELIKIILEQDARIRELEKTIKEEQKKRNERFAKPNTAKKRRMKPGQKPGHVGMTRATPDHIDEIINETLHECPDCHHALGAPIGIEEQIQEDIILARVHVRKYLRHKYHCPHCGKEYYAPYHPEHVPLGYLGANVLIQAVILKYHHCLPYRKIRELFQELAGITVSPGGIAQALARISKIKRLINDASKLRDRHDQMPSGEYTRLRVRLDMFRFLKDPSLDWNTNRAERMIRPNVIYRNRSYGNHSDRGAEAHGTIMSLMQTLRLQGQNVGENLRQAFLRHRQGITTPQLNFSV